MSKQLKVAYRSQTDNLFNPMGSCNVTAVAMALNYHGIVGNGMGQLEDQLYQKMLDRNLNRHSPIDLRKLINSYDGIIDDFTERGTFLAVQRAIDNDMPVILHGYFTKFGHIVLCYGYDDKGLLIHDPYGEWHIDGYDINDRANPMKGQGLHYSYKMIARLCSPESEKVPSHIWAHFVRRTKAHG